MIGNKYSPLFQFTFRFIKYFFLVLIGISIAFAFATGVGYFAMASKLLAFIFAVIRFIGIILLCLIAITMITESLR